MSAPVPSVSVVIAVRNGAATAGASLEGVLTQSGPSLEVIIVDDGSTDATPQLLAAAAARDPRVTVIRRHGAGLTASLAVGLAAARGEYVARHDLDDVSLPGRFAAQVACLESRRELAAVGTGADVIDEEGRRRHAFPMVTGPERLREGLLSMRVTPVHGSMMLRRAVLVAAGAYRVAFTAAQDYDLWLRLTDQHAIDILPETYYQWRLGRGSTYTTRRGEQLRLAGIARVFADERARFGEDSYAALAACGGDLDRFLTGYRLRGRLQAWWGELLYRGLNEPRTARRYLSGAIRAGAWRPRTLPLWLCASVGLPWPGRSPLAPLPRVSG